MYNSTNEHLQNSLALYGLESFQVVFVEISEPNPDLTDSENQAALLEREQHWLNWLFLLSSEYRYNFSPTAGSNFGYKHTEKTRANISKAQKGENHPFYGKKHTEETKALISVAKSGPNNPMYSRTGSLSSMYGTIAPRAKTVYLYSVEGQLIRTFTSQVAAPPTEEVP